MMLTWTEGKQVVQAILSMNSPASFDSNETCYKRDVINLLSTFTKTNDKKEEGE